MQARIGKAFGQLRETATQQLSSCRGNEQSGHSSDGCTEQQTALNVRGEESPTEIIRESHCRTEQQAFESASDVARPRSEQEYKGVVADQVAERAHQQT